MERTEQGTERRAEKNMNNIESRKEQKKLIKPGF